MVRPLNVALDIAEDCLALGRPLEVEQEVPSLEAGPLKFGWTADVKSVPACRVSAKHKNRDINADISLADVHVWAVIRFFLPRQDDA